MGLPELALTLWLLPAVVVAPGARALFAGESVVGVRSIGPGTLRRLGLLFPARRASITPERVGTCDPCAARGVIRGEVYYRREQALVRRFCSRGWKQALRRCAAFFFLPVLEGTATAHGACSLFRCVSQARPKWPSGHMLDGRSELVVFNRTEFRTSAPR